MSIINLADVRTDNPFPPLSESENVFPVVTRPLQGIGKHDEQLPAPDHKGVYRVMDGEPVNLGVVGIGHKLITNKAVYETAEEGFLNKLTPAQLKGATITDYDAKQGAWSRRLYTFPGIGTQIESLGGTTSRMGWTMSFTNAYDGSSSLRCITGWLDFFCTNGMESWLDRVASFKRHTASLTTEYVEGRVGVALDNIQDEVRRLQLFARTELTADQAEEFFLAEFSEARSKKLMEQFEEEVSNRGASVWALVSAMTFMSSHNSDLFRARQATRHDTSARTLANRADEVTKIMAGDRFERLLAA